MCVGEQDRDRSKGVGKRMRTSPKLKQKHSSIGYDEEEQNSLLENGGEGGVYPVEEEKDWLLDMPTWKQVTLLITFFTATTMLGYEMGSELELPHFLQTSARPSDLIEGGDADVKSKSSAKEPTYKSLYGYELGDELEDEVPDFFYYNGPSGDAPTFPLYNESFAGYLTHGMNEILAANKAEERKHKKHYVYDSWYERRWPHSHLPKYLRKTIPYNKHIPHDKEICYVHVGKAGGSTGKRKFYIIPYYIICICLLHIITKPHTWPF